MKTLVMILIATSGLLAQAEPACETMLQCQVSYRFPLGMHHYYDVKVTDHLEVQMSKTHPHYPEVKLDNCYAEIQHKDSATDLNFFAQVYSETIETQDSNQYTMQLGQEQNVVTYLNENSEKFKSLNNKPKHEMTDINGRIMSNVVFSCMVKKIRN
jgi:hypothetical protein